MNPTTLKTLSRLVLAAFACCATSHAATILADFAADFSPTSNPSGPWTYGSRTTLGASPTLSTDHSSYGPLNEVLVWNPAGTLSLFVGLNTAYATVEFTDGSAIIVAARQGILHPGPTGAFANVHYTAASDFTAVLSVQFSGLDRTGTSSDVHILLNGQSLFSTTIDAFGATATYTTNLHLTQGDLLDFPVGWGNNGTYFNDSTGFFATLSTADTPEPATCALLALSLAAITAVRRPRR